MREIAAANLMKTSAQLNYEDLVPGWPPTDGSKAMFAILDAVSRDLDMGAIEVDDPASRGFGDFNFIGSYVSGVDGLGVKGDGAHSPNESMDPKFLGPATQRAAVLFSRVIQLRR
jgi:glutamate carboxypeptidase